MGFLALGFWPLAPDLPRVKGESHPGPQAAAAAPAVVAPQTINIAAGTSIQAALDKAAPGDTIVVAPGTYHESVTVKAYGITLKGQASGDARPGSGGARRRATRTVGGVRNARRG